MCAVMIVLCFVSCSNDENNKTDLSNDITPENILTRDEFSGEIISGEDLQNQDEVTDNSDYSYSSDNSDNTSLPTDKSQAETSSDKVSTSELVEQLKNSDVVTYYSDNPGNSYICAVSEKYGADKSNLVALIKTNAIYPGAMVLEFNGKRDSEGKLVFSRKTLVAVYDINGTDGTIRKASKIISEIDGYTEEESKTTIKITEWFVLGKLDELRETRVYPE